MVMSRGDIASWLVQLRPHCSLSQYELLATMAFMDYDADQQLTSHAGNARVADTKHRHQQAWSRDAQHRRI